MTLYNIEPIYAELNSGHRTYLYFEAHVTLDPVGEDRYEDLEIIAKNCQFRVAEFLYKKSGAVAHPDDFLTGRSDSYSILASRLLSLLYALDLEGFTIQRYKIENTLVDARL